MRVKHSILNISAGLGSQLIITLLSFVSRTVFIYTLGVEYLGINGLFTSILLMLSIAEAGIGSAIMYSLYKPLAEEDTTKVIVLMKLYKQVYRMIAIVVLLLGLAIMPFLPLFVKETSVQNLQVIYMLFLANTALPYFFLYKNSFLNVCQKGYIVTAIYTVSQLISTGIKIGILYYTQNYILFLGIDLFINLASAIIIAKIVDRQYPYLGRKTNEKLDQGTKGSIVKNVKAIVLQRIGGYFVFGTDNILISAFVSIAAVGIYSNYVMLIEICRTFINQVFNNLYHSVGNLVASETKEKVYEIYKVTQLLSFWLYAFFAIFLSILIQPFIDLWIGSNYLLDQGLVTLLMLMFFERGMRNPITTVKTTAGIFHEDRYAPIVQAIVNLIVSLVLVQYFGLAGIFIGSLVSAIVVPFWITPYLVYRKVLQQPVHYYFLHYAYLFLVGAVTYSITIWLCSLIPSGGFGMLLVRGMVCFAAINLVFCAFFVRSSEFKYLFGVASRIAHMVLGKLGRLQEAK